MDTLSKSLGYDRQSYPFISSDGYRSLMTDAVDDLVLWLYPGTLFPITAYPELDGDTLRIVMHDDSYDFTAYAYPHSCDIVDSHSAVVGSIVWNTKGLDILKATIKANDPQPDSPMYVDAFACVYRQKPVLSSISVNGVPDYGKIVTIDKNKDDASIQVEVNNSNSARSINLYNTSTDGVPITTLRFDNVKDKHGFVADGPIEINVDRKHVWLKSDAECDIRVCTTDSIIFTEISNDKL